MSTFGVVIPARDGEKVIGRALGSLVHQRCTPALHVVVVVNGSCDGTRSVAERYVGAFRSRGHVCEVLTAPSGRAPAIRIGEDRLRSGNRLYLDCDATLSDNAVEALDAALQPGTGVHFAAPRLVIGSSPSAVSRAYFRAWCRLPYVTSSPVTYGAYAVSAEGRRRWGELPLLHSDDKFARLHFRPSERRVVDHAAYEVIPPSGFGGLLTTRRRYLAGNRELSREFPELVSSDLSRRAGSLGALLSVPSAWPSAASFLAIYGLAATLENLPL